MLTTEKKDQILFGFRQFAEAASVDEAGRIHFLNAANALVEEISSLANSKATSDDVHRAVTELRHDRKMMEERFSAADHQFSEILRLMDSRFLDHRNFLDNRFAENLKISESRFTGLQNRFADLQKQMDARFTENREYIDARFTENQRQMDVRFAENREYIDKRFTENQRQMDVRFAESREYIDKRFTQNQKYLDTRFSDLQKFLTIGLSIIAVLIALFGWFQTAGSSERIENAVARGIERGLEKIRNNE